MLAYCSQPPTLPQTLGDGALPFLITFQGDGSQVLEKNIPGLWKVRHKRTEKRLQLEVLKTNASSHVLGQTVDSFGSTELSEAGI